MSNNFPQGNYILVWRLGTPRGRGLVSPNCSGSRCEMNEWMNVPWVFAACFCPGPSVSLPNGWLAQGSQPSQSSLETGPESRAQDMPLCPRRWRGWTHFVWHLLSREPFLAPWEVQGIPHHYCMASGRQLPALSWSQFPQCAQVSVNLASNFNSNTSNKLMSCIQGALPLWQALPVLSNLHVPSHLKIFLYFDIILDFGKVTRVVQKLF